MSRTNIFLQTCDERDKSDPRQVRAAALSQACFERAYKRKKQPRRGREHLVDFAQSAEIYIVIRNRSAIEKDKSLLVTIYHVII